MGRLAELPAIVDAVVAVIGSRAGASSGRGRATADRRAAEGRRPVRSPRRRQRRWDARSDRPGPLHRQSIDRQDGHRDRGRGPGAWRAGHPRCCRHRGDAAARRDHDPCRDRGGDACRPPSTHPCRRRTGGFRCARHGGGGRRFPAVEPRRDEARAWRRSDPRARADTRHPRPARADRAGDGSGGRDHV